MKILTAEDVHAALSYPAMVDALQEAYSGSVSYIHLTLPTILLV